MSDAVILEIVKTVGIAFTAIVSLIAAIWTARGRKETKELSVKVDGRLSDLLEATKKSSELEGHKAGVAEQKAETKSEIPAVSPIKLELGKVEVVLQPPTVPPPEK